MLFPICQKLQQRDREEIGHGLGIEKCTQIDGQADPDGPVSDSRLLILQINRPYQGSGKKFRDAYAVRLAGLFQFRKVYITMQYTLLIERKRISIYMKCLPGAVFSAGNLFVVAHIAVLHIHGDIGRYLLRSRMAGSAVAGQIQVPVNQRLQEIDCSQPIRYRVKHLQIDPFLIVADPEQIVRAGARIDILARIRGFPLDHRHPFIRFKIVPEKTASQPHRKSFELRQYLLQRTLKRSRNHLFL